MFCWIESYLLFGLRGNPVLDSLHLHLRIGVCADHSLYGIGLHLYIDSGFHLRLLLWRNAAGGDPAS